MTTKYGKSRREKRTRDPNCYNEKSSDSDRVSCGQTEKKVTGKRWGQRGKIVRQGGGGVAQVFTTAGWARRRGPSTGGRKRGEGTREGEPGKKARK